MAREIVAALASENLIEQRPQLPQCPIGPSLAIHCRPLHGRGRVGEGAHCPTVRNQRPIHLGGTHRSIERIHVLLRQQWGRSPCNTNTLPTMFGEPCSNVGETTTGLSVTPIQFGVMIFPGISRQYPGRMTCPRENQIIRRATAACEIFHKAHLRASGMADIFRRVRVAASMMRRHPAYPFFAHERSNHRRTAR